MSREQQLFDALEGALTLIDMSKAPDWFAISARSAMKGGRPADAVPLAFISVRNKDLLLDPRRHYCTVLNCADIGKTDDDSIIPLYEHAAHPLQAQDAAPVEPTLRESADALAEAGHAFWTACRKDAGGGAVRWLDLSDGTLIIFTRLEYKQQLLAVVDKIPGIPELYFQDGDEESGTVTAIEKVAAGVQGDAARDDFNGDNAALCRSIEALLALDAAKALVPHGVGGHARGLLSAAMVRLSGGSK